MLDLDGVRRREPDALDAFFQAFADRLYGLAYRLVGERTQAEDLTQEVFLRVYRFADTLDVSREPWPWLATIAHRALADRTRRGDHRLHHRAVSLDAQEALAASVPATVEDPTEVALSTERERLVQRELDSLPEDQRTVIVMRNWHGLSHREIAEATGRTEVAARKLYSRAVSTLGTALKRVIG